MKVLICPALTIHWTWYLDTDNGRTLAKGMLYRRRPAAVGAALRVLGLELPRRPKGVRSQTLSGQPQPRGGTALVHVIYGAGGRVTYAQWSTEMELIELVSR